MPDVPNFPTYCTNRFMISVPKKPHTAKLFCWNFKIQELNNFHKFDKYAISLPEVLFGGSFRVVWDRHYKVWILGRGRQNLLNGCSLDCHHHGSNNWKEPFRTNARMQPKATHLSQKSESEKEKYILTCRDVWRLGGWCDKVSGCYWPEMTVKAVFANFTATSPDICPLLFHPPHPLIEACRKWKIEPKNLISQCWLKCLVMSNQ